MLELYKKALLVFLLLLLASALMTFFCVQRTFLNISLLPGDASEVPWEAELQTDVLQGGNSQIKLLDERYSLDFELKVSEAAQYPFTALSLAFRDPAGEATLIDLSLFHSLSFNVKCTPANVLLFSAFTVEDSLSVPGNAPVFRSPSTYFSCDENWSQVELDLTRLETPTWWMEIYQLKFSKKEYKLDRVPKIQFGTSNQSPKAVASRVQVNALTIIGRDWRYMYVLAACLLFIWSGYGVWFFRAHTQALINNLRSKVQKDRPLVAYQQLSVEPQYDRDKDAILRFMATEYANPELNLDVIVNRIAVTRTKINDILKDELGFTFTSYLNKLRLTEAARLLAEKKDANVAEIAYSVGYKNVSYFNKLFKEEYGCTPKTFITVYDKA